MLVHVNIHKEKRDNCWVVATDLDNVFCASVDCLHNNIDCSECIFTDHNGDLILAPTKSYNIDELERFGRVKR